MSTFEAHLVLALRDKCPDLPVTVFLRNKNLDTYLSDTAQVKRIVHGTFDEKGKVSALAREHDIVINVGSSWDVGLSEAIVDGLKKQPDDKKPILIHMSGTGNFVDKTWTDGAVHEGVKVWNVRFPDFPPAHFILTVLHCTYAKSDFHCLIQDDDPEDMKLINPDMLNGGPDTV